MKKVLVQSFLVHILANEDLDDDQAELFLNQVNKEIKKKIRSAVTETIENLLQSSDSFSIEVEVG